MTHGRQCSRPRLPDQSWRERSVRQAVSDQLTAWQIVL